MTIHNLYIFDRKGTLVYYSEWNRKKARTMSREEEGKLVYGMLFSLRSFLDKISPLDMKENSFNFKTSKYKLNYWESPSKVKIILNTDLNTGNTQTFDLIKSIYKDAYVEYVMKNPMIQQDYIQSELFQSKVDEICRSSIYFK